MKQRPWNDGGAEIRFLGGGNTPQDPRERFWGSIFCRKIRKQINSSNVKNAINKSYQKRAPRNTNIDAKRVPKGKQHRYQNTSKIEANIGFNKKS